MKYIESINSRLSTRTFNNTNLNVEELSVILSILSKERTGPFGSIFKFTFLDIADEKLQNLGKMSSYGIIKGTNYYFGSYCNPDDQNIIDYGYCFEEVVLELNSLGFSTCWLGGTFGRSFISEALSLPDNSVVPAISPVGFSADKRSLTDKLVRYIAKASKRKNYEELFYLYSPNSLEIKPIYENSINGDLKIILKSIQVAPSASNKQPWRILISENTMHLYWDKDEKYNAAVKGFNIQALDMGIAICHITKVLNELSKVSKNYQLKIDEQIDTKSWKYITSFNF